MVGHLLAAKNKNPPENMIPASTIVAQATPSGRGGVGIVRLSGPLSYPIALSITQRKSLMPRYAHYGSFYDPAGQVLDEGLCLWFPQPHSFTGEDVVEFQAHGGPIVMQLIITECLGQGAVLAKPGEFSERAFLNDKLDLAQAEAIADLIQSSSAQAARLAVQSLQGTFSQAVETIVSRLIQLRMYVEAAIDFPEEEIDFLQDESIQHQLHQLLLSLTQLLAQARQGQLMREGVTVVIVGRPNAGKSSLLNALVGSESAIVTAIPGTTRDILKEQINIRGIPLHVIDTAGLRETQDLVEAEGIRRAREAMARADRVLLIIDQAEFGEMEKIYREVWLTETASLPMAIIVNKIDQTRQSFPKQWQTHDVLTLSAKTGEGVETLKNYLLDCIGYDQTTEGQFIARERHVTALVEAKQCVTQGLAELQQHKAGELLAEDLRQAQQVLSSITGRFTADDLLGEIFSSFCIGK